MKVAAVGLGYAAAMFHVPAVQRVPAAELVGGMDISAERRAAWERETGSPAYSSMDELLERVEPEIVIVATPPHAHVDSCRSALEAGAHVFCEKPLAESVADVDRVLAAAADADRLVSVNLEFREHPIFRAVRDEVESGSHGRLAFCQVWQLLDLPPWDEPSQWRAEMADRALLEGGIHLVDLLIATVGERPVAVTAQHSAGVYEQRDADAIQLVTVEFPEGRLGQITQNRLTRTAMRYLELRADCERGSLRASFGGRAYVRLGVKRAEAPGARVDLGIAGLAWVENGHRRKRLARNPRDAAIVGSSRLLAGLLEAVRNGREPPSSGREARDVHAVIEAAYESARTGRRVELSTATA
jgi:predicted dehydrogenase